MSAGRTEISLMLMVAVVAIAGCKESSGPEESEEGRFGIGNGGSFVTTGGAEVTFVVDLLTNRMSFNAKGYPASGVFNFQGKVLGFDDDMHGDVICYAIASTITGNKARVGGVITKSDLFAPGIQAMWSVEDNGEGSNGIARDQITVVATSDVPGAAQAYCDFGVAFDELMYPIETGNVQVHL